MKQIQRIPLLDFYRFLAALSVVGFHYWSSRLVASRTSLEYGNIFDFPWLDPCFKFGMFGVDLFFLISGFVIALSAEGRTFAAFSASRITRVVPTYWVAIILTTAFLLHEGTNYREVSVRQILANVVFLQGLLGEKHIDGVYWSIIIELRFYLLVALLILINCYQHYSWLLLGWVLLCLVDFMAVPIGPLRQVFITTYGYYFAAGGAFYFLHQRKHITLSLVIILLSMSIAIPKGSELFTARFGQATNLHATLVLIGCYGLMALIATRWFDSIRWRWLPIAGSLTYPLYLIHEDIGFILMRHINISSNGFILTLVIIALMLQTAWLIHRYFEQAVTPPPAQATRSCFNSVKSKAVLHFAMETI